MKFGQVLVQLTINISNSFLFLIRTLEATPSHFMFLKKWQYNAIYYLLLMIFPFFAPLSTHLQKSKKS